MVGSTRSSSSSRRSFGSRTNNRCYTPERSQAGKQSTWSNGPHDEAQSEELGDLRRRIADALDASRPKNETVIYFVNGLWGRIAFHPVFENLTLLVIALNAVYIALDTDYNKAPTLLAAHPVFQLAEHGFCIFFAFELVMRFMCFVTLKHMFKDRWFIFDSVLVAMMVLETWLVTAIVALLGGDNKSALGNFVVLRLFRLLRLTRMVRVMRAMPELMVLIKGMMSAMRSVMTVMTLLLACMFLFAVAIKTLVKDTEVGAQHFSSVGDAMYSLMIYGVLLDGLGTIILKLKLENIVCAILFLLFVMIAALTLMNMLIGVLCDVVSTTAQEERYNLQVDLMREKMYDVLEQADGDKDGMISKAEFSKIMQSREVALALKDLDIDPINIVDFTDYIFDDSQGSSSLEFEGFMDHLLSLRGANIVTVKHFVELRKTIDCSLREVQGEIRARSTSEMPKSPPRSLHYHCNSAATLCSSRKASKEKHARCSLREAIEHVEGSVAAAEGLLNVLVDEVRALSERLCPVPPAAPPTITPHACIWHGSSAGSSTASSAGSSMAADHVGNNRAIAVANDQPSQMEAVSPPSPLNHALARPSPPSTLSSSSEACFLPGALADTASIS